jgi:hypothetical protein
VGLRDGCGLLLVLLPRMDNIRRWGGLRRRWGVDAGADQKQEIDEQDCDEDETADEDVGTEAHYGLVAGKIRGRDVLVLVVAFVMMFWHGDKLTLQTR